MGEGLGHGSGDDHDRGLRRPSARRAPAAPGARGDGRRDHGRVPPALRPAAGPTPALDRDAAARVRPGAARRPHAPGRGDCADLHPTRPRARARGLRRRGGLARLPAPRLRHVTSHRPPPGGQPGGAGGAARASWPRHLGRNRRRELPRHARVRRPSRRGHRDGRAAAASASAVPRSRSCGKGTVDPPSSRVPCPRSAARSSPTPTASCSRSTRAPAAVAFASSVRGPEVSQVGAPCPDHLINTKHKPLVVEFDPASDGAAELRARLRAGVDEYSAWYRRYYERNVDDETRRFPIDPAGPRVVLVPGVGIVTTGSDAGGRGSPATSTTGRSPFRMPRTRSVASAR